MSAVSPEPLGMASPNVITVASRKGGVGKTSVTSSLAAALASRGYRVVVCDLDPQANLTETLTGERHHPRTVADLLSDPHADVIVHTQQPTLDVIPSGLGNLDAVSVTLPAAGPQGIRGFARAILAVAQTRNPDFVLVDTPPNMGPLTATGIAAAHWVVAPTDVSCSHSVTGSGEVKAYVDQMRADGHTAAVFGGMIANRVPGRRRNVVEEVCNTIAATGIDVATATIPDALAPSEGAYLGCPGYFADSSKGRRYARAVDDLADEVIGLVGCAFTPRIESPKKSKNTKKKGK